MGEKDHSGKRRAFIWSTRAWYHNANMMRAGVTDEVNFGMYADGGGATGEMSMAWCELGGESVPQLKAFDDSWGALSTFTDLIQKLGKVDDENITPQEFVNILLSCGFVDDTVYDSPYTDKKTDIVKRIRELECEINQLRRKLQANE